MKILFFRETELKELNPAIMAKQGLAGTENSIICLAQELSKKHTVKVIAPQLKQQFFDKVEYIPFQSYSEVLIHYLVFNPDIFIICGNPSILYEQNFANSKKFFWQQNHPRELEGRFNINVFFTTHPFTTTTIIAPSLEAAKYYNSYYKTNKVIGIYNGVRHEFFKQTRNPIKDKITYCGSFTRAKGLDLVLLAAQKLPEYQFNLCGSFDLYGFVDETYKQHCLSLTGSNTHFVGSLPANKLAQEFASSSLCIANPLIDNNETCCISALESMVIGTPVITGPSEIMNSIISHGGVTTTNLVETIRELMISQPVYKNKEFTESLSWDFIAKEWEKVFEKYLE
jgi:glycosyltransferase involved in cell wall biosynthesis